MVRAAFLLATLVVLGLAGSVSAQEMPVNAAVGAAIDQISDGDRDGGLARLEALAADGDLDAHDVLGELYAGNGGVPADRRRSCEHFQAAREVRPSASHNYGQCLWEGAYGERDLAAARIWYGRAADGGFLQAKCALGNMLMLGDGGPAEPERGIALCREAAEAGEANAQADMGDHYGGGAGVPLDYGQARQWYERAAAQHQRNAAFQRGVLDWNGLGGPVDLASASAWLQRAYADGRRDAAQLIGRSALIRAVPDAPRGPVDVTLLAEAKHWFAIATTEDPTSEGRARSAAALAMISGYEEMARGQAPLAASPPVP